MKSMQQGMRTTAGRLACVALVSASCPRALLGQSAGGPATEIDSLVVTAVTGNDDLRSDSRVNVIVEYFDAGRQRMRRWNLDLNTVRGRGPVGFHDRQRVVQQHQVASLRMRPELVRAITIEFRQGGGGLNGDNWNLDTFVIACVNHPAPTSRRRGTLLTRSGRPFRRFTGTPNPNVWTSGVLPTYRGP